MSAVPLVKVLRLWVFLHSPGHAVGPSESGLVLVFAATGEVLSLHVVAPGLFARSVVVVIIPVEDFAFRHPYNAE